MIARISTLLVCYGGVGIAILTMLKIGDPLVGVVYFSAAVIYLGARVVHYLRYPDHPDWRQ